MTKIKVVTVPESMLPRPKQIESSDLKIGSCIDELAPEVIKHNAMELLGDRDRLIRFQEKFKPLS